jgi:hypothetical protein
MTVPLAVGLDGTTGGNDQEASVRLNVDSRNKFSSCSTITIVPEGPAIAKRS